MASKKFPYKAAYVACNPDCQVDLSNPCRFGCVGCGQCVEACKFGAIVIDHNGIAVVDTDKCIGCGACTRVCPRELIRVHEIANSVIVRCSNKQKGADAKAVCSTSCLGCGICEKTCTATAIKMTDNLPVINESLCLSCGMCLVKCPRGVMGDLRGIL